MTRSMLTDCVFVRWQTGLGTPRRSRLTLRAYQCDPISEPRSESSCALLSVTLCIQDS